MRRLLSLLLILLSLAGGLAGCGKEPPVPSLDSEKGKMTFDEAIYTWGNPTRTEKSDTLKVATWERTFDEEYLRELTLWFDKDGKLIDWKVVDWEINDDGQRTKVKY